MVGHRIYDRLVAELCGLKLGCLPVVVSKVEVRLHRYGHSLSGSEYGEVTPSAVTRVPVQNIEAFFHEHYPKAADTIMQLCWQVNTSCCSFTAGLPGCWQASLLRARSIAHLHMLRGGLHSSKEGLLGLFRPPQSAQHTPCIHKWPLSHTLKQEHSVQGAQLSQSISTVLNACLARSRVMRGEAILVSQSRIWSGNHMWSRHPAIINMGHESPSIPEGCFWLQGDSPRSQLASA